MYAYLQGISQVSFEGDGDISAQAFYIHAEESICLNNGPEDSGDSRGQMLVLDFCSGEVDHCGVLKAWTTGGLLLASVPGPLCSNFLLSQADVRLWPDADGRASVPSGRPSLFFTREHALVPSRLQPLLNPNYFKGPTFPLETSKLLSQLVLTSEIKPSYIQGSECLYTTTCRTESFAP